MTNVCPAGRDFYFNGRSDTFLSCSGCHVLNPSGNVEFGVARPGFFGTDGRFSFEQEPQIFKIPHLRNLYQKVGQFGCRGRRSSCRNRRNGREFVFQSGLFRPDSRWDAPLTSSQLAGVGIRW